MSEHSTQYAPFSVRIVADPDEIARMQRETEAFDVEAGHGYALRTAPKAGIDCAQCGEHGAYVGMPVSGVHATLMNPRRFELARDGKAATYVVSSPAMREHALKLLHALFYDGITETRARADVTPLRDAGLKYGAEYNFGSVRVLCLRPHGDGSELRGIANVVFDHAVMGL